CDELLTQILAPLEVLNEIVGHQGTVDVVEKHCGLLSRIDTVLGGTSQVPADGTDAAAPLVPWRVPEDIAVGFADSSPGDDPTQKLTGAAFAGLVHLLDGDFAQNALMI